MALKLLIAPATGAILGAQGVGAEGVDKRIDVIATAIRGGITAPELADLELAYAPPFGSAKDPVNMLGYIAENRLTHLSETVQWSQVRPCQDSGYLVLDVRSDEEFAQGAVPDALSIPSTNFATGWTRSPRRNCWSPARWANVDTWRHSFSTRWDSTRSIWTADTRRGATPGRRPRATRPLTTSSNSRRRSSNVQ